MCSRESPVSGNGSWRTPVFSSVWPVHLTYSIADQVFHKTASLGIYRVSLELMSALARESGVDEMTVFANRWIPAAAVPETARRLEFDRAGGSILGRLRWDQWGVYRAAATVGSDWLFLPKGYASFLASPTVNVAVFIHDIMPVYLPEHYPGYCSALKKWHFTQTYKGTLRAAKVIFTNSDFSRRELARWADEGGLTCPPVHVVGYGINPPSVNAGARRDRVLIDIRSAPHKRADLAIDYLEKWRKESAFPGRITCCGSFPEGVSMPKHPGWEYVGRLHPEAFTELMATARAAVHFSEYEGFGLPPVEAVIAGACPVFSDVPATMEAMLGAGCPFSDDSYDSFAGAMQRALACDSATIARWRETLLARHRWNRVASEIVDHLARHSD